MTDIPEHLLARSRERREALGLGGGDAAGAAAAPAGGAPAGATSATPAVAAAAAVVVPEVVVPPKPVPPYVAASKARPRVPIFVAPVLAALPIFAFVYWGTMTPKPAPADPVLALGAEIYANQCAACHGATGGGGVGRPLDEVVTTFPDAADHIAWITNGSVNLKAGDTYGVGRQALQGKYNTVMPAFADKLSAEEIAAVVRYEREEFGGEVPPAEAASGAEAAK